MRIGVRPIMGLCLAACCWGAGLTGPADVRADDLSARYFEQLRKRQLFNLAELYCADRLEQPRLSPAQRAEYTLELARTLTEHALHSGGEQAEMWQRAEAAIDELLLADPDNPRRLLLEVQRALIPAAQGEFYRWQYEVRPFDDELRRQALTTFDAAVTSLIELERTLAVESQRPARRGEAVEGAPRPHELRRLQYNVRFRLGTAFVEQARLHEAASSDRLEAVIEAEKWLRPLVGGVIEELTGKSQVLLVQGARLRGDFNRALQILDVLERAEPPEEVRDALTAERAHALLSAGRPADAAQVLLDHRKALRPISGELYWLNVKALVELWQTAQDKGDAQLAGELLEQVETHVERAEREAGGYWGYRSRQVLETSQQVRRYGAETAERLRKAQALYAAGQTDEALAAYGEAAAASREAGNDDLAVELSYTAASIRLHAGDFQSAEKELRELVERFPQHKQTAEAHILRAYCLGRLYDDSRTQANREAYTQALLDHREQFAGHATEAEAVWMLARLEERRLQVSKALALYGEIPPDHPRAAAAQPAIARCYEGILERLRELRRPTGEWERAAIVRLGQFVESFPPSPEPLSAEQAETALRLARIRLHSELPDYAAADRLLARVLSSARRIAADADRSEADEAVWKRIARGTTQLRILSLAGQGRPREAALLVEQLSQAAVEEALSVLDGLARLAGEANAGLRRELAELQLKAAQDLDGRRDQLSPEQQTLLDHCLAQACAATDQPLRAIEIYSALLEQSPKDRKLLATLAELQMQAGRREQLQQALSNWRKLESLEKGGSPAWLNARYHVAWCTLELNDREASRKLLGVTRLLYPDLGGEEMRARFLTLEERVRGADRRQ